LLDRKGRVLAANELARALFAGAPEATPLARGRQFLQVSRAPELKHLAAVLPPRTRALALEPYGPRGQGWEGGLLILEPRREGGQLRSTLASAPNAFSGIIGAHPQLLEAKRRAARIARASAPVLLLGESGVGKQRFARAIHESSPVAAGPCLGLRCRTFAPEQLAIELFGDEVSGRLGRLQEADGGTLFLDDIDVLPLPAQLGLVRALQDNVVLRMGGQREYPVRVRLVAGTQSKLNEAVAAGRFRLDLFYRLKVFGLRLPALRDRLSDLPLLAHSRLLALEARYGLGPRQLSLALQATLTNFRWPGNVYELHNLLEAMYLQSESSTLTEADLPEEYRPQLSLLASGTDKHEHSISGLERSAIEAELLRQGDNLSAVARRLGISRSTLYRKMKRYGLAGAPAAD
jgi:DNA-binding NtrC family response regulator